MIVALQAISFELCNRQKCGAWPDQAVLNAITPADINSLQRGRSAAMRHMEGKKDSTPTTMDVPAFKGTNFDEFMTAFKTLAARQIGANELPLDYLMRPGPPGNYND